LTQAISVARLVPLATGVYSAKIPIIHFWRN
jgi:hypothetical protein